MDLNSDRNVDSDDLEEINSNAKKKQNSDADRKKDAVLSHFHDLTESDSDRPSPNKKIKSDEGDNTEGKDEVQNKPIYSTLDAPSRNTQPVSSEDTLLIQSVKKYQFFLTCVKGIPPRYNFAVAYDIKDLLSLPDGSLVASAQVNILFPFSNCFFSLCDILF